MARLEALRPSPELPEKPFELPKDYRESQEYKKNEKALGKKAVIECRKRELAVEKYRIKHSWAQALGYEEYRKLCLDKMNDDTLEHLAYKIAGEVFVLARDIRVKKEHKNWKGIQNTNERIISLFQNFTTAELRSIQQYLKDNQPIPIEFKESYGDYFRWHPDERDWSWNSSYMQKQYRNNFRGWDPKKNPYKRRDFSPQFKDELQTLYDIYRSFPRIP